MNYIRGHDEDEYGVKDDIACVLSGVEIPNELVRVLDWLDTWVDVEGGRWLIGGTIAALRGEERDTPLVNCCKLLTNAYNGADVEEPLDTWPILLLHGVITVWLEQLRSGKLVWLVWRTGFTGNWGIVVFGLWVPGEIVGAAVTTVEWEKGSTQELDKLDTLTAALKVGFTWPCSCSCDIAGDFSMFWLWVIAPGGSCSCLHNCRWNWTKPAKAWATAASEGVWPCWEASEVVGLIREVTPGNIGGGAMVWAEIGCGVVSWVDSVEYDEELAVFTWVRGLLEVGLELTISFSYCVFKFLPMILLDNAKFGTGVKLWGWFWDCGTELFDSESESESKHITSISLLCFSVELGMLTWEGRDKFNWTLELDCPGKMFWNLWWVGLTVGCNTGWEWGG